MADLGFVVLEWNQASRQPSVCDTDIYATETEASDRAEWFRTQLAVSGRRERYSVASLIEVDEAR